MSVTKGRCNISLSKRILADLLVYKYVDYVRYIMVLEGPKKVTSMKARGEPGQERH